jgi:hypothetical protein
MKRADCETALAEARPVTGYDPGGSVAAAEKERRASLEAEILRIASDIEAPENLSDADLVARFVPEIEAQRKAAELAAEGYSLTDALARGPVIGHPVIVER